MSLASEKECNRERKWYVVCYPSFVWFYFDYYNICYCIK